MPELNIKANIFSMQSLAPASSPQKLTSMFFLLVCVMPKYGIGSLEDAEDIG